MNFDDVLRTVKINERKRTFDKANPKAAAARKEKEEADYIKPSDISRNVYVATDPGYKDPDRLTYMLMANKVYHHRFDPELQDIHTKYSIKDMLFQDTKLAPYKPFVNRNVKHITEADMVEMLVDKYCSPKNDPEWFLKYEHLL